MTALYKGQRVNIASVSSDKKYVLASNSDNLSGLFKIDVSELTEMSVLLQAELNKEGF